MNISFFIQPKIYVAHLYEDFTIRQGMETMKYHGYSAIPVLNRENEYLGTISEGDFLWTICNFETLDIWKDRRYLWKISELQILILEEIIRR